MNRATALMICAGALLALVAGCSATTSTVPSPSIAFLQPPHNRLLVEDDTLQVTFEDATKVVGQPCTCAAAGFQVARTGLDALFEKDVPVRGELRLVASKDHAVGDVVAFILGTERRAEERRSSFLIDPSLSDNPGVWRYIVAEPTSHRAVVVTFHRWTLMPDPLRSQLRQIEERADRGEASSADRETFRTEMARMVEALLDPERSSKFIDVRAFPYAEFERSYPALASHGHGT